MTRPRFLTLLQPPPLEQTLLNCEAHLDEALTDLETAEAMVDDATAARGTANSIQRQLRRHRIRSSRHVILDQRAQVAALRKTFQSDPDEG